VIPEAIRYRIAELAASYRWLWRASQTAAPTPWSGAFRFVVCVAQDLLGVAVWCVGVPLRHPVQRDRVVIPGLAMVTMLLVSLYAGGGTVPPAGLDIRSHDLGEACAGGVYLGAISAPGDEFVTYQACAEAVSELRACPGCGEAPGFPGLDPVRERLSI